MKTKQEIFDTVLRGMRKQGKPSVGSDGFGCYYRSPDGCKCGIGMLIADEDYRPYFDGRLTNNKVAILILGDHIRSVAFVQALHNAGVDGSERDMLWFLMNLQDAHDNAAPVGEAGFMAGFESRMEDLAHKYSLMYEVRMEDPHEP